jgi:hypothetical protein
MNSKGFEENMVENSTLIEFENYELVCVEAFIEV